MIRAFIDWNIKISRRIDGLFNTSDERVVLVQFLDQLKKNDVVADVGGGKKPVLGKIVEGDIPVAIYDGFDIDIDELEQARDLYSNIHVIDLTKTVDEHHQKYSKIMCASTLEHVLEDSPAFKNLSDMLQDGGELYVKVPYKNAIFALLNRLLPNDFKKRILHFVFPEKIGDGFPAYYKGCSVSEMTKNAENCNMKLKSTNKIMTSSYFMFFIPFYLIWRSITLIQLLVDKDYCESFEAVFVKQDSGNTVSSASN